jgi:hypothetical protein
LWNISFHKKCLLLLHHSVLSQSLSGVPLLASVQWPLWLHWLEQCRGWKGCGQQRWPAHPSLHHWDFLGCTLLKMTHGDEERPTVHRRQGCFYCWHIIWLLNHLRHSPERRVLWPISPSFGGRAWVQISEPKFIPHLSHTVGGGMTYMIGHTDESLTIMASFLLGRAGESNPELEGLSLASWPDMG